ncbi:hypothetical protein AB0E83_19395 [Streptomyces sp. NPDC035033]|uniref:hypothetical protein n=1 Tax=Streptomyces sp. NPDC035033 TaxID=3155368 RepID=UPI0033C5177D
MTTDHPHVPPADDDIEPTRGTAQGPAHRPAVSPASSRPPGASPFPDRQALPPVPPADRAVTVLPAAPAHVPGEWKEPPTARETGTATAREVEADREPVTVREATTARESVTAREPVTAQEPETARESETAREARDSSVPSSGPSAASGPPALPDQDGSGDEAIHTLLRTAATERPVEEVAALVARLQETGELSSPADVALRAAAVSRPVGEVRQLLVLLNASGYDLHQAETTLRAAAVGRPIEDVVQLVGILGTDSDAWRPAPGVAAAPAATDPKRADRTADRATGRAAERRESALNGALATGPGSHDASPALRSALRWPAAVALFVCGLVHLPTDLAGLRSGGDAQTLSVVVSVLSLVCAVWLASRDTLIAWAASAGLAVVVIVLHGVASARAVDLLAPSLGTTFAWARALALLSAMAVVFLAGSALVRHAKAATATDGA